MTKGKNELAEAEDISDLSATLAACLPKERLAIEFRLDGNSMAQSCKLAGYGLPGSTNETLAKIAYRLFRRDRVLAALLEECKKSLRNNAPEALKAAREILADAHHRDRYKIIALTLDRSDQVVSRADINVKVEVVDHAAEAVQQLRILRDLGTTHDKLEEFFGHSGLPHYERLLAEDDAKRAISVEFTEIKTSNDAELDAVDALLGE
jgi:hypothetical protein